MSRGSSEMFASFDGMEVAGGSSNLAVAMGQSFAGSMDSGISTASVSASNSLPTVTTEGMGIA
ncbi:MAG: hypothetical protein ACK502_00880 [Alphaproteobacteria bacterium]